MIQIQTPPEFPAPPPEAAPVWDLTVGLINATVQLDQPSGEGTRTVGTGFLVQAPKADGTPRVVLVTAAHVFVRMEDAQARIGWRTTREDASWRYSPEPLVIRDAGGQPLWRSPQDRDIAVMEIVAPEAFARAAIPLGWLADEGSFGAWQIGPGDELLSLGFPRGLSSNRAGFPILRVGRIASYPLSPTREFPTFLIDFPVFPGNSGGPVFWTPSARKRPDTVEPPHPFIGGILTQEVQVREERLEIGVVTHAIFIREAIALLDAPDAESVAGP